MAEGIFVLMMVWATNSYYGGEYVVYQEHSSFEKCEVARKVISTINYGYRAELRVQGCFKR